MDCNDRHVSALLAVAFATLMTGCASSEKTVSQPVDVTAVDQAELAASVLPVSYNEVMVALVNEAADPIWKAAWRNPDSEKEWRQLERRAFQLKLAGTLLSQPASGPIDKQWSLRPEWNKWATQLTLAGNAAISAVDSRSQEDISRAGDMIVEVCEGCHLDFKPDLPTGGKYGELSLPPSALDKE